MHISIKCSTCKFYAFGYADDENSLDKPSIKTMLCSKHKLMILNVQNQLERKAVKIIILIGTYITK